MVPELFYKNIPEALIQIIGALHSPGLPDM